MEIVKVTLYHIELPLLTPFITSYGAIKTKAFYLIEVENKLGNKGYGELEAFEIPDYTEETRETAGLILVNHLLPLIKGVIIEHPQEVRALLAPIRGNEMAKAALETAIWDLYGKEQNQSIQHLIGANRLRIPVGVSIGIQPSIEVLLQLVGGYVATGYQRVKLKIKPRFDQEPIAAVRKAFPELTLMADANSAYTKEDLPLLKALDEYDLAMIEQPFGFRDFVDHAWAQSQLKTRVCLDENIRCLGDVQLAHQLGSCQSINLKLARVGGLQEALEIADYCQSHDILVWCGGMLEAGIGRAFNLALASRNEFTFPGDISASNRYFAEDIIKTTFDLVEGEITVPSGDGIGVEVDWQVVKNYCLKQTDYVLID